MVFVVLVLTAANSADVSSSECCFVHGSRRRMPRSLDSSDHKYVFRIRLLLPLLIRSLAEFASFRENDSPIEKYPENESPSRQSVESTTGLRKRHRFSLAFKNGAKAGAPPVGTSGFRHENFKWFFHTSDPGLTPFDSLVDSNQIGLGRSERLCSALTDLTGSHE